MGAVLLFVVVALAVVVYRALLTSDQPNVVGSHTEAERFVDDLPASQVALWDSVANCESEGNWTMVADPFYGGLQFTIESWREVEGTGRPDHHPREEQIMRAELLLAKQGWQAWPACAAQLGLR